MYTVIIKKSTPLSRCTTCVCIIYVCENSMHSFMLMYVCKDYRKDTILYALLYSSTNYACSTHDMYMCTCSTCTAVQEFIQFKFVYYFLKNILILLILILLFILYKL